MKISKELEGSVFHITLSTEAFATADPQRQLWAASNCNGWDINDAAFKIPPVPHRGVNSFLPLKFKLPKDIDYFEFKIFDKTYNRWCEPKGVDGDLYEGMEEFFVINAFGSLNVKVNL